VFPLAQIKKTKAALQTTRAAYHHDDLTACRSRACRGRRRVGESVRLSERTLSNRRFSEGVRPSIRSIRACSAAMRAHAIRTAESPDCVVLCVWTGRWWRTGSRAARQEVRCRAAGHSLGWARGDLKPIGLRRSAPDAASDTDGRACRRAEWCWAPNTRSGDGAEFMPGYAHHGASVADDAGTSRKRALVIRCCRACSAASDFSQRRAAVIPRVDVAIHSPI